jgi:hypothetical protein
MKWRFTIVPRSSPSLLLALLIAAAGLPALGQQPSVTELFLNAVPSSAASTDMYFAQLADGGGQAQNWTTTLVFQNPNVYVEATVNVDFYGDDGKALNLDFGAGAVSSLRNQKIPPGGLLTFTSRGTNPAIVAGWARATSDTPVVGTLVYRAAQNGTPRWSVATASSGPTYVYRTFGNSTLGVALVNPSTTQTIHLKVSIVGASGAAGGSTAVTLEPNAHTSFVLGTKISGLDANHTSSVVVIPTDTPVVPFVAWAMNAQDDLFSPLPVGGARSPAPARGQLLDAYYQARAAIAMWGGASRFTQHVWGNVTAAQLATLLMGMPVVIDPVVNNQYVLSARYQTSDNTLHVSWPLVDALGESRGALAFLLVHYAARGVMVRTGSYPTGDFAGDPAGAADLVGLAALLVADMDPGGMADFYGRLQWAVIGSQQGWNYQVDPALLTEFSFPNYTVRATKVWSEAADACVDPTNTSADLEACELLHTLWYPHMPPGVL